MTQPRHTADSITDNDLDALYAERDALIAELDGREEEARERWIQQQLDQTGIKAMDFRNGMSMEIEPARELVAHWVGAARAMLGDAPNYTETPIEMEIKVGESPERFAFVLQRVGKLTPHEARQQAEERAARYKFAYNHARERAAQTKAELAENTGVMQALRRQRDQAEAALDAIRSLAERWQYTADRKHGPLCELRAALDTNTEEQP